MTDSVGATCTGLGKKYRRGDPALTDVDLQIHAGEITGLLGRNGSGKTTLMRLLGGELFPSSGKVQIDGHPAHSPSACANTCLVADGGNWDKGTSGRILVEVASLRPSWSGALFEELLDYFRIDVPRIIGRASKGMQSTFALCLALASGAELTLLDEIHLGMDQPTREKMYEQIVRLNGQTGRGFVLSSHLISEIEQVIGQVVVLERGQVRFAGGVDALLDSFTELLGPREAVMKLQEAGIRLLERQQQGSLLKATVDGALPESLRRYCEQAGIQMEGLDLAQTFRVLTEDKSRPATPTEPALGEEHDAK